jgi:type IV pilus assembly protein PilB
MADDRERIDLGEELVRQDLITREELATAQERERVTGTPWYRQLIQMKKVNFGVLEDVLRYEFHPKSVREEHQSLGETLVGMHAISNDQLKEALVEQERSGRLLGNILLDRGWVTRQIITRALSRQHNMEYAELDETPSEQEALDAVAESMARKNLMVPVKIEGDRLTVLITSPQSQHTLRDVGVLLGMRIQPILTTTDDIRSEITARYRGHNVLRGGRTMKKVVEIFKGKETAKQRATAAVRQAEVSPDETKAQRKRKETQTVTEKEEAMGTAGAEAPRFDEIARQASGMPVVRLVTTIIEGAVNSAATDIHLDPQDPEMRVRYRIDGTLHDVMSIPPEIETAVISRLKIMADMDITETRRPQDGHISMEIGDGEYDVRVATLPTFLGERVVLRLLDQSAVLAGIKDLGLEPDDEKRVTRAVTQPYGMILVTGPTGSGKTTTLYAALNQKNVMTESIVTLEDPVEYQLSGINQVQIDPDINMTFATTLRAALRQDIDVILVGEIRDPETAQIGVRAAMTGHLMFSTLHTNDAPEAISTLRNMGVPSFLLASALTAVIGQRLVRKICEDCKVHYKPTKELLQTVGLPTNTAKLYRGKGCPLCYHTGTRGRTGIFEVLEVTTEIRRLIAAGASAEEIGKEAKMKTLADRCRVKVKRGECTAEEYLRVTRV